jgi:cell division protein FtsB
MRQLIVTILFFVFMFLLVNMYIGRVNAQDYDYQQQQIQQLQRQQDDLQFQQDQRQLNNSINAINHGCVYTNGREFCN